MKSARKKSSIPTPKRQNTWIKGLSLTLFFPDTATTRDINKAQIYAWKKGIKTLYYIRLRQLALEGTEIEGCVSCAL